MNDENEIGIHLHVSCMNFVPIVLIFYNFMIWFGESYPAELKMVILFMYF